MMRRDAFNIDEWEPKTQLGKMVKEGTITSISDIFRQNLRILEPEIVDILLPDLEDEVINIQLVQRQTDAGRKRRFKATCAVGNRDGFVGIGEAKVKEVGPAIRKAILNAKLAIMPVRRGCGSWECGCTDPHSLPFKVEGKCGSTRAVLHPAPKGLGLAVGKTARIVLSLGGVRDIWSETRGDTRTRPNYAKAVFQALRNTYKITTPMDWHEG